MEVYSDLIVAGGVAAYAPRSEIDVRLQESMHDPSFLLWAKDLCVLLLEPVGEPLDPFEELHKPAEVTRAVIEGLVHAELVMRM